MLEAYRIPAVVIVCFLHCLGQRWVNAFKQAAAPASCDLSLRSVFSQCDRVIKLYTDQAYGVTSSEFASCEKDSDCYCVSSWFECGLGHRGYYMGSIVVPLRSNVWIMP